MAHYVEKLKKEIELKDAMLKDILSYIRSPKFAYPNNHVNTNDIELRVSEWKNNIDATLDEM